MNGTKEILNKLIELVGEQAILDCIPKQIVEKATGTLMPLYKVADFLRVDSVTLNRAIEKGSVDSPIVSIKKRDFYSKRQLKKLATDFVLRHFKEEE